MSQHRDDLDMVPNWALQRIREYETAARNVLAEKDSFSNSEPASSQIIDELTKEDLSVLLEAHEQLFVSDPQLSKHIHFLLWRSFLRGWTLAEAKWKSGTFSLPNESRDRNPNGYIPRLEDFA